MLVNKLINEEKSLLNTHLYGIFRCRIHLDTV